MSRSGITRLLDLLRLETAASASELSAAWLELASEPGIVALVAQEGAEVWLYRRLRQVGVANDDPSIGTLRASAHRSVVRGLRVDDETVAALARLDEAEVPVALIKGQARRAATALYPWADARSISDVDLLVRSDHAQRAWDILVAGGYTFAVDPARSYADHHHLPPIIGSRKVAVEIHTSTSPGVPPLEAWRRTTAVSDPVTWSGRSLRVPCATELLWHAVDHAFVQGPAAATRLRALLDGAAILSSGREIDWDLIRHRMAGEVREADSGELATPAKMSQWLAAAAELGGVALPASFSGTRPLPIEALVRWRQIVRGAFAGQPHLIEEASRCEMNATWSPVPPTTPAWKRARRTLAAAAARACYRTWRAVATQRGH